MQNPLSGLSPAQLQDGVSVLSALYALDLATTDRYDVKIQWLTNSFTDTRMRAMFREAKEQLDQTKEMFSSQRKGLQRPAGILTASDKAREIKTRNLTAIKGAGPDVALHFMSPNGSPDYTKDTVVGTTPKKRLFGNDANVESTPMTLSRTQKDELISRLQDELTYDTFSQDELELAQKALDDQVTEKQQVVQSRYSLSAERGALDSIFRVVALYVLKNCQGADMTPYLSGGKWNWRVPSPRQPNSIYTLEVLTGTFRSQLFAVNKPSALEYLNFYDQELPKFEWLLDLYLPEDMKNYLIQDIKNLFCGRLENNFKENERVFRTLNSSRPADRQAIESSFDFYKTQLRMLYPLGSSYLSAVPGIHAVNVSDPEGDDTPVVGHLGQSSQRTSSFASPERRRGPSTQKRVVKFNELNKPQDESPNFKKQRQSEQNQSRVSNPDVIRLLEQVLGKISMPQNADPPSSPRPLLPYQLQWLESMCPTLKTGQPCTNQGCTANHGRHFGKEDDVCRMEICPFQFGPRGCQKWHPSPAVKVDAPANWDYNARRPKNAGAARR